MSTSVNQFFGTLFSGQFASRLVLVFAAGFAVLISPVMLPAGYMDSSVAQAQAPAKSDDKANKKAPMEGKKTQALSKAVYELITQANELVDAEQYKQALQVLDKIKAMPKLTPYETAQLYSFYGFLYFNAERYPEAVTAYNTVLKQPELPPPLQQQTIRTLAQLAFVTEDYPAAIKYANQYLTDVGPDADIYVVLATAYYQQEKYKDIIPPVEKAIDMYAKDGKGPKEQWLLLLRVAYWELKDYKKVKDVLEQLVAGWPKKEYLTQLSGVYYELKDEAGQLAAFEAAYDAGWLSSNAELVQMAQLFMQAEIPYKGAVVLEKGLESKQIERNERNLRLLSQAWQMAQEDRKAISPLKEAAALSGNGELYVGLAQSYFNLSEYSPCIDSAKQGISKGGLKSPGNAYMVLGMCQFESKSLSAAKESFRRALSDAKVAKNASSWISYVESEEERQQQLKESMSKVESKEAQSS